MVAVALGGAAVLGAGAQIISGNKATKATTAAADKADATQRYIYDSTRADLAPWKATGEASLGKLSEMYGVGTEKGFEPLDMSGFETSPGYQFRIDEATKAIERSASARGGLRGGGVQKAIGRYVSGIASDEYNRYADRYQSQYENYANRLAALAGVGQTANAQSAQAGQNYAANASQNAYITGQANAANAANTGSAINQGITNVASAYLYNKGYNQPGSAGTVPDYGYA